MWQSVKEWFLSLGTDYGVDPLIFGIIYVGAIPFFLASIAWLVRNRRAHKPILLPVLSSGLFFVSAYVYLAIAGRNIPVWVWFFMGAMVLYGIWSTVRDVRKKIAIEPKA
mgnify:CR=1 FL=1